MQYICVLLDQCTTKSIEITKIIGLIIVIMMLNNVDAIRINFMKDNQDLKANPFLTEMIDVKYFVKTAWKTY
jgi:hypothetical protein